MTFKTDLPVEAGLSRFDIFPDELILKVMGFLSVTERLQFAAAYPQFQEFRWDLSLFKKTLTVADASKNLQSLLEVLDPNGTAIKISLGHNKTRQFLRPLLILDTFAIMQHLQEVTLTECQVYIGTCTCRHNLVCNKQCLFMRTLLTRPKVLNLHNCNHTYPKSRNSSLTVPERIWQDWAWLFDRYIDGENQARQLQEITLLNTLPIVEFQQMSQAWSASWTGLIGRIPIEVENLEGEVLNLTKIMRLDSPFRCHSMIRVCHRAIYKTMGWSKLLRDRKNIHHNDLGTGITFRKVRIRIGETGIAGVRLTEDFDVGELKRELDDQFSRSPDTVCVQDI